MNSRHSRCGALRWALVASVAALAACGGGRSTPEGSQPSAPVDSRQTLTQYLAARPAARSWPLAPAPSADQLAAPVAWLQGGSDQVFAGSDLTPGDRYNRISVPALVDGLRPLLLAAATGATLAQIQSHWPDPGARSAPLVQRELWAQPQARFLPSFLNASDRQAPLLTAWRAGTAAEPAALKPDWPDYLGASSVGLDERTALLLIDQVDVQQAWPTGSSLADGLWDFGAGYPAIVSLRRVPGEHWTLAGPGWQAEGLKLAQSHLIRLQPAAGRLEDFLKQGATPALAEVIARLHQGLPAAPGVLRLPEGVAWSGWQLGWPAAVTLPLDKDRAELTQIDGAAAFAQIQQGTASWEISEQGMRLRAGLALTLKHRADLGSASGVFSSTWSPVQPPPCPALGPPLRSHVLVWLDAQYRLIGLQALRRPAGALPPCEPS
ncbi:MAG: hypothetical protein U1E77_13380 [Inhella sp.]